MYSPSACVYNENLNLVTMPSTNSFRLLFQFWLSTGKNLADLFVIARMTYLLSLENGELYFLDFKHLESPVISA
jgi:hypothetical protein